MVRVAEPLILCYFVKNARVLELREAMLLSLKEINKAFGQKPVLSQVSLDIDEGEVVVLLGPSGCGKTTLLRIIAGLEKPDAGSLLLAGKDLSETAVHQRGFGLVFQEYALFPHKNVFQNVAFGLRMLNWEQARINLRVQQVLEVVGLSGFDQRAVHELSGGERQRVALARSLTPAPRLLLLDEPLGALDRALRERLMIELRAILKNTAELLGRSEGITAIYVTHDQAEAFAIADRVVVMNHGRVEQSGTPMELYQQPLTSFVARFLGMENVVSGEVISVDPLSVATPIGVLQVGGAGLVGGRLVGDRVELLIRPEAGRLQDVGPFEMSGTLASRSFRGRYQIATIVVSGAESEVTLKLEFDTTSPLPAAGSVFRFTLDHRAILLLRQC